MILKDKISKKNAVISTAITALIKRLNMQGNNITAMDEFKPHVFEKTGTVIIANHQNYRR